MTFLGKSNEKQFVIEKLTYDGNGPDAFFYVGKGEKPLGDNKGYKVPDENNIVDKILRRYEEKDVCITLPDDMTIRDIDYISLYCIAFSEVFGIVNIPHDKVEPLPAWLDRQDCPLLPNLLCYGASDTPDSPTANNNDTSGDRGINDVSDPNKKSPGNDIYCTSTTLLFSFVVPIIR